MTILRKLLGRERLSWATETENLPDFGLTRIEMKLLAVLIAIQTCVLTLLLL